MDRLDRLLHAVLQEHVEGFGEILTNIRELSSGLECMVVKMEYRNCVLPTLNSIASEYTLKMRLITRRLVKKDGPLTGHVICVEHGVHYDFFHTKKRISDTSSEYEQALSTSCLFESKYHSCGKYRTGTKTAKEVKVVKKQQGYDKSKTEPSYKKDSSAIWLFSLW